MEQEHLNYLELFELLFLHRLWTELKIAAAFSKQGLRTLGLAKVLAACFLVVKALADRITEPEYAAIHANFPHNTAERCGEVELAIMHSTQKLH